MALILQATSGPSIAGIITSQTMTCGSVVTARRRASGPLRASVATWPASCPLPCLNWVHTGKSERSSERTSFRGFQVVVCGQRPCTVPPVCAPVPFVPDLCVEVLLDRNSPQDIDLRVRAYLEGGACEVIVVCPLFANHVGLLLKSEESKSFVINRSLPHLRGVLKECCCRYIRLYFSKRKGDSWTPLSLRGRGRISGF